MGVGGRDAELERSAKGHRGTTKKTRAHENAGHDEDDTKTNEHNESPGSSGPRRCPLVFLDSWVVVLRPFRRSSFPSFIKLQRTQVPSSFTSRHSSPPP